MPITFLIPKFAPSYFQQAVWPDYLLWDDPATVAAPRTQTKVQKNNPSAGENWWGGQFLSGTASDSMTQYRERQCVQFVAPTGYVGRPFAYDWPMSFPMEYSEVDPKLEERRVYWDTFFIAKEAGADISGNTGALYTIRSGPTTPNWPNNSYGLIGVTDGWEWRAYNNAGVLLDSLAITWPVALTAYCRVDVLHFPADPAGDGSVQLLLNGIPTVSRSFGTPASMPSYQSGGLANADSIQRQIRVGAPRTLWAADMRFRTGKYDFSGVEVQ